MTVSLVKRESADVAQLRRQIAGQLEPSSVRVYSTAIRQFCEFIGGRELADVTREDVIAYRAHLLERYPKNATAQSKFAIVCRLFDEAMKTRGIREAMGINPCAGVRGISVADLAGTSKHVALELDAARRLVEACENARDRLIVYLLLRTGLRRSELAQMRVGMIQAEGAYWKVVITGKGRKRRVIAIPDDAKDAIDRYLATRDHVSAESPLFPADRHNARTAGDLEPPLSADRIYEVVRAAGRKIGIPALTAHSMRATFVTLALNGGAPIQNVQYAAGHADIRTTQRYHKSRKVLEDAAARYFKL